VIFLKNNCSFLGSFRDPSGMILVENGVILRCVRKSYKKEFDHLIESGLYEKLAHRKLLIPHKEVSSKYTEDDSIYKTIQPEQIPFISYPYEWSFTQLKDAAKLTLQVQKIALQYGMILKDASAYNVQFYKGKPIFIDTLSFEIYDERLPWVAYQQFCKHFLVPLVLMQYLGYKCGLLPKVFIDGVDLDLASSLLPWSTRFRMSLLLHIHIHAKSQNYYAGKGDKISKNKRTMGKVAMQGLIDSLFSCISNAKNKKLNTEWGRYYRITNYSDEAMSHKKIIVEDFINRIKPASVCDLGGNNGTFSRIPASKKIPTLSFDIDPVAIDCSYKYAREKKESMILPLVMDLTNPSPSLGWSNRERMSFTERVNCDMVLALALIHHLAISNNVPLKDLADFFAMCGKTIVIEFVPKADSQVKKLLDSRKDIFYEYDQKNFESIFSEVFKIIDSVPVNGTVRTLYLMERKS
jgi:hypothetical protein